MSMPKLFLPAQGYGFVSSPALIYRSLKPRMHVDSRWISTGPTIQYLSPTVETDQDLCPHALRRSTCQGVLSMNPSPCSMSATPPARICALTDQLQLGWLAVVNALAVMQSRQSLTVVVMSCTEACAGPRADRVVVRRPHGTDG
jgi:hypothetical protein